MKLRKNILKAMLARCISCHIFVFNIKTFLFTFQLNICHFMPTSLGGGWKSPLEANHYFLPFFPYLNFLSNPFTLPTKIRICNKAAKFQHNIACSFNTE